MQEMHNSTYSVPCLHVYSTWPSELAYEALSGSDSGNDASRGDSFQNILCVPSDKVTVVDNVLFSIRKLKYVSNREN